MKKLFAVLLALTMLLSCAAAFAEDPVGADADLIAAAQAEGELIVYGSCEVDYLAAAVNHFQELYGIKTQYQRLSTGEVPTKIEEENGNPSADVWFGGTNNPYDSLAAKGFLDNSYVPANAAHLTKISTRIPTATGTAFTPACWASWSTRMSCPAWAWKRPRAGTICSSPNTRA